METGGILASRLEGPQGLRAGGIRSLDHRTEAAMNLAGTGQLEGADYGGIFGRKAIGNGSGKGTGANFRRCGTGGRARREHLEIYGSFPENRVPHRAIGTGHAEKEMDPAAWTDRV